jgi:hypothetical protein
VASSIGLVVTAFTMTWRSSFQTRVTVPTWSKDNPAGMSAISAAGAALIATDVGVFRTTNLGKTWIKVGANLPLVPINDIDLPAGSETLYAATYGRRVWTTSLTDIS